MWMGFRFFVNVSAVLVVSLVLSVFSPGLLAELPPLGPEGSGDNAGDVSVSAPLECKEFRSDRSGLADGPESSGANPAPDWFVAHRVDDARPGEVSSISVPATSPRSPPL